MNTVVITGANRGLGFGLSRHYLQCGWQVVATYRSEDGKRALQQLEPEISESLVLVEQDVASEDSIRALPESLAGLQLDCVINNAGVCPSQAFGDWAKSAFESAFAVNAIGPALVTQAVAPLLGPGAKLINISSRMGSITYNIDPSGDLDAYSISKAALNAITKRSAARLRDQGIIVAAMSPGWVKTDMGGQNAALEVAESVTMVKDVIDSLDMSHTGGFFGENGDELPW